MSLERYISAQKNSYENALGEIKSGKKRSHWMWYIFPQIKGLGFSEMSRFYGIDDLKEAKAYLGHSLLGKRLREISNALLDLQSNDAHGIFGSPDDMKLHSSMTLFAAAEANNGNVFEQVLLKFFNSEKDKATTDRLNSSN